MFEAKLPTFIDPYRAAQQGLRFDGVIPMKSCQRLVEIVLDSDADIRVQIQFDKDEQGLPYIKGIVTADVVMECQRCFKAVCHPIKHEFLLSPIANDEQAEDVPSYYEPVLVNNHELDIGLMIEDEVILALPFIVNHPETECETKLPEAEFEENGGRQYPFANLKIINK